MALPAGMLRVKIEYAKDLKDSDLFVKQDPYVIAKVGAHTFKTKVIRGGGTNPVFNETFLFPIINENQLVLKVMDEDTFKDDELGTAVVNLREVRERRSALVQAPVKRPNSGKVKGFVSVSLEFTPNSDMKQQQQQMAAQPPQPIPQPVKPQPIPQPVKPQPIPQPVKPQPIPQPVKPQPAPQPAGYGYPQANGAPHSAEYPAGFPGASGRSGPPGYPAQGYPVAAAGGFPGASGPSAPGGYPGAGGYPPSGYPPSAQYGYGAPPPLAYAVAPPAGYPEAGQHLGAPPPGYPGAGSSSGYSGGPQPQYYQQAPPPGYSQGCPGGHGHGKPKKNNGAMLGLAGGLAAGLVGGMLLDDLF